MPSSAYRTFLRVALAAAIAVAVLSPAGLASAHNSLVSSSPADGATLDAPPSRITWTFANAVPLETLTVTLIDASGARSELSGSTHGAGSEKVVVTPLPTLPAGPTSIRWRLVGPDGHPVTGRVDITVATPATPASIVTPAAASVPPAPTTAETVAPSPDTAPPTVSSTVGTAVSVVVPGQGDGDDGATSTPSLVRWLLRSASYLAILAIVGSLVVSAAMWSGAATHPAVRRVVEPALVATAVLGLAQLLVVASDISGRAPWSSFGSVDAAMSTHAGMALAIRVAVAIFLWLVLFRYEIVDRQVYWTAVSVPAIGLLGTWAFAGHSRSLRWPTVGVVTDVAHHAAAAAWLGGLVIAAWIVIPQLGRETRTPVMLRFSRMAMVSVAVLVTTGLIQTLRLVGGPTRLFEATHGRILVAKLVALAAMLALAGANRSRLSRNLTSETSGNGDTQALRRGVLAEFAIGLVIIGLTAAMVVSPPAVA